MNRKIIDANLKPLFQKLEETGILLDEEKLTKLIQRSQRRLAEQKQAINREVGFVVNPNSDDHLSRALGGAPSDCFLQSRLLEARKLGSLVRKLQQVYDLANGNYRVLNRQFGLYPKYGFDLDRNIVTVSELSVGDLPEEALGVISYRDKILIKATYTDIVLSDVRELSGDPWIMEATVMDLMKLGFINLFEDYRIEKLGSQVFALVLGSVYLFAPEEYADSVSSACRECLESACPDFTLPVDIIVGRSFQK